MIKKLFITASFAMVSFGSAHAKLDLITQFKCTALNCGASNISGTTLNRCIRAGENVIKSNPNCANAFLNTHCMNNSDVYKEECTTIAEVFGLEPPSVKVQASISPVNVQESPQANRGIKEVLGEEEFTKDYLVEANVEDANKIRKIIRKPTNKNSSLNDGPKNDNIIRRNTINPTSQFQPSVGEQ